ncbi:glutathione synthase [bacterium A37T11]|nr:glutathione synthase [bacterium A37T11]
MNIGFVVNQLLKETAGYTSTALALQAHQMGHTVHYIGVGDLVYLADEHMGAHARTLPDKQFRNTTTFLEAARAVDKKLISSKQLDVLLLRNDPSADMVNRPWAQHAGILFGKLAKQQGVLVLNDPDGLANASSKMYLQYFPKEVRPQTLVTRSVADVEAFYRVQKQKIIVKPLQGSGGKNVFLIDKQASKNLSQIVEAVCRDGFAIAQEYLPAAKNGDVRLFLMDGKVIRVDGKVAAINRRQKSGEIRSNIHQGGSASKARITKKMLELVAIVGPKLHADGMFLVGLDIVGDKLMEINVFSPGGLVHASNLYGVNFFEPVIKSLEERVRESGK